MTKEDLDFEFVESSTLELFTEYTTDTAKILLLKKRQTKPSVVEYIKIDEKYDWISNLQNAIAKTNNSVVLYAHNAQPNGILGLVNCLRREPNGSKIKCFFSLDTDFNFDIETQNTEMAINIYQNNERGTYRHLLLPSNIETETKHCLVTNGAIGDLSSLKWFEGPLSVQTPVPNNHTLVYVSLFFLCYHKSSV